MRTNVVAAGPDDLVEDAERRMLDNGIRGMPVIEGNSLIGMFTATDALRARVAGVSTVKDMMTRDLIVAHPGESLHSALQKMTRSVISRLPVVERDSSRRLVGILGMRDLASILDLELNNLAQIRARSARPSDDPLRSTLVLDAMNRQFVALPMGTSLQRAADKWQQQTHMRRW